MATVRDIAQVQAKIDAIENQDAKLIATQAANVAFAQAQAYATQQAAIVKELAKIRQKIDDNTATDAEKTADYKKKSELIALDNQINNSGKLVAEDVRKIKQEQLQKKLDTLKGSQGKTTFADAEKIFEYVLRTQALNPYSRERACDIDLLESIIAIAKQTSNDKQMIQSLVDLIKEVF